MSDSYFIKRGENISGPFTLKKLQKALSDKKLKANDELSTSNDGPWERLSVLHKDIRAGKHPHFAESPVNDDSDVGHAGPWTATREIPQLKFEPPAATQQALPTVPQSESIVSAEEHQPSITSSAVSEAESIKAPTRRGVWVLLLVVSGFFSLASGFGILDNLGAFESQAVRDAVAESDRLEAEFNDNYESNARGARNAMYDVTGKSGGLVGAVEDLRDTVDDAANSAYVETQQEEIRQRREADESRRNGYLSRSVPLFLLAFPAFCFSVFKLVAPRYQRSPSRSDVAVSKRDLGTEDEPSQTPNVQLSATSTPEEAMGNAQQSPSRRNPKIIGGGIALAFLIAIIGFAATNGSSKPKRPEQLDKAVIAIEISRDTALTKEQFVKKLHELETQIEMARINGHDVVPYEQILNIYHLARIFRELSLAEHMEPFILTRTLDTAPGDFFYRHFYIAITPDRSPNRSFYSAEAPTLDDATYIDLETIILTADTPGYSQYCVEYDHEPSLRYLLVPFDLYGIIRDTAEVAFSQIGQAPQPEADQGK